MSFSNEAVVDPLYAIATKNDKNVAIDRDHHFEFNRQPQKRRCSNIASYVKPIRSLFRSQILKKTRRLNPNYGINSIQKKVRFTTEIQNNNQLLFPNVLLRKNPIRKFLHIVSRKRTHADRYLNAVLLLSLTKTSSGQHT